MNAKELRRRRRAVDLSQEELANALGVSRQTVWDYEKGNREIPRPFEIAFSVIEKEQLLRIEEDDG